MTSLAEVRAAYQARTGRPLRMSDAALTAFIAELREPEPAPADGNAWPPPRRSAAWTDRADASSPHVRWSNDALDYPLNAERPPERSRLAAHRLAQPEFSAGLHLPPSEDGTPTYGRHEPA